MYNFHHVPVKARHAVALVALVLFLLPAALSILLHRGPPPPEPSLGGRTLTQLALLNPNAINNNPRSREAKEAVRAIGTNALPCLLAWLSADPESNRPREAAKWFVSLLPDTPGCSSIRAWAVCDPAVLHFEVACVLFGTLGADAAPAIPELERLASDVRGRKSAYRATYILTGMGPQAVPALQRIAANPASPARKAAAEAVKRLLGQPRPADSTSH